jgi:acyl-CoA synthetase (AMP-forming)/AMP-acid ligase II/acyl carrier protein
MTIYTDLKQACLELDRRHTGYRFDLMQDLPWDKLSHPGLHLPDGVLTKMGINVEALREHPAAYALLQWSAGLEISTTLVSLKTELMDFIDQESAPLGPVRSSLLIYQEIHKHHSAFSLYGDFLKSLRPSTLRSFHKYNSVQLPTTLLRVQASSPALKHFQIWANTLLAAGFFSFLGDELQKAGDAVHPVWLALHQAHREELLQHLPTAAAHLHAIALPPQERASFISSHQERLGGSLRTLFPLIATRQVVLESFPELHDTLNATAADALFSEALQSPALHDTAALLQPPAKPETAPPPPAPAPAPSQPDGHILMGLPYKAQPAPHETLVDRFIELVSAPRDPGLVYIKDDETEISEPYGGLFNRAKGCLDYLRAHGAKKHDPVMIQINRPESFLPVFWGAILGGMIPVPLASMMTLGRGGNELNKTFRIYEVLDQPLIVTDQSTLTALSPQLNERLSPPPTLLAAEDVLAHQHQGIVKLSPSGPDDTAFIQFSSGSTGTPKGVCLSHQNLLHNITSIIEHQDGRPEDCFVSWLPLFHDMGLIGYHLLPVVLKAKQVLMHPRSFMKRPVLWLKTLDRHRGTCTASPNFGLNRVIAKITPEQASALELSHVRCLLNGSEPISATIMHDFLNLLDAAGFPPNAMSPGYGLAEGSLCISAKPAHSLPVVHHLDRRTLNRRSQAISTEGSSPNSTTLVEVGTALQGVTLRIVNDQDQGVEPGVVGHIQIRGPNVTKGYYKNDALTEAAFVDGWLRTGDLGLILDGHLVVTGRHKDVLFMGGANYYAHDIEDVLIKLPWFTTGRVAVFGSSDPTTGQDRVCIAGVFRPTDESPDEQYAQSKQRISEVFGLRVECIIPLRSSEIPKTSSGKIQRHLLRDRFEAGALTDVLGAPDPVPPPKQEEAPLLPAPPVVPREEVAPKQASTSPEALMEVVLTIWSRVLQCDMDQLSPESRFSSLGGTSLQAADVHAQLEEALGVLISHAMLAESETPLSMARYIQEQHPALSAPSAPPEAPHPALLQPDPADYQDALAHEHQSRIEEPPALEELPASAPPSESLVEQFGPNAGRGATNNSARTPIQALVCAVWAEVLKVPPERVTLEAGFRSLGGTSMQAAEIHAALEDRLGGLISHELLTNSETAGEMADYIQRYFPELVNALREP